MSPCYRHVVESMTDGDWEVDEEATTAFVEQRIAADEALRASEARYRALFESSPFPKWVCDVESLQFLAVNQAALRQYGYSREELLTMTAADLHPPEELEALARAVAGGDPALGHPGPWKHRRKDGSLLDVEVSWQPFAFDGHAARVVIARDVTDRTRLEAQLRQAQKMEAIGSLAGGVAHDFNNVLSVILSYAALVTDELAVGSPLREDMDEIRRAGERATALTRQLLAFSRQQVLQPCPVELNELLAGTEKMLRRLLGDDISLSLRTLDSSLVVVADPGQLEQIVMNLVVNARDAMQRGGDLLIETSSATVEGVAAQGLELVPGAYAVLRVTDTGSGIDTMTLPRIFDPFFTTKEKGKGTGLGLATVFGIVKQSGGCISVESVVGRGTTFTIHLPRAQRRVTVAPPSSVSTSARDGTETILLVEDDDQVRGLARTILRRHGYDVIEAANGGEALLICEELGRRIDVLVTDVVMPRMSGRQLARRLGKMRPEMRVICMSGHTPAEVADRDVLVGSVAYLQKPITPDLLLRKVREVLGCSSGCGRC